MFFALFLQFSVFRAQFGRQRYRTIGAPAANWQNQTARITVRYSCPILYSAPCGAETGSLRHGTDARLWRECWPWHVQAFPSARLPPTCPALYAWMGASRYARSPAVRDFLHASQRP